MRFSRLLSVAFLLVSFCLSDLSPAGASQVFPVRRIIVTLIPDFEDHSIQFDGQSVLNSPSDALDVRGLPLRVEGQWKDPYNPVLYIRGTVQEGRVDVDPDLNLYHLRLGPVVLGPQDELKLILPFVNLDYSQIEPAPDAPDDADAESRQRTHRFTYRGGASGREIQTIDIPFTLITRQIDLTLTPLVGEVFLPWKNGVRLSGKVVFSSISDFDEFSWHCQSTANRVLQGDDYRSADLLYALDYPHYYGPDVLNSTYAFKPTLVGLRSELAACQYDQEKKLGQVEAVFSGRTNAFDSDPVLFPAELRMSDVPDGNFSYAPPQRFRGVNGYTIRLGRIMLAPGDILTITVPGTNIQIDSLAPVPDDLVHQNTEISGQETQIVYKGPAAFELFLPYVAQSGLYVSQFPAFLRPTVSVLEKQLGEFLPFNELWLTWLILGAGLLLLGLSRIVGEGKWLALPGGLLVAVSLFYGLRGSFGLLAIALALYLGKVVLRTSGRTGWEETARKAFMALLGLGLIALAIYVDRGGAAIFQGLSEPGLSPLTPLVLMMLVGALFLMLYGKSKDASRFTSADLPVLVLFLVVLALYDAFNKSLLALLILLVGVFYVSARAIRAGTDAGKPEEDRFGKDLPARLRLSFGNRIVPAAMLILIVFAIVNDLSSTYANEMQIRVSPLLTPLAIPLLSFVSVFIAFTSIALLFVLIYPFLPSTSGYIKAVLFAVFLFLVFLFGIGTDDRLIASLPNLLVGRVIYYFSVPLLIGIYFDINEFMRDENQRLTREGKKEEKVNFQTAGGLYLKHLQGWLGTLVAIFSLLAPSIYAFASSQPVITTYFSLLEKLVLLPL
jgi:hypothetical protein